MAQRSATNHWKCYLLNGMTPLKKSPALHQRQGEVYLYDYATDTLIHTVVDVATGSVQTEYLQGVQMPLTTHEEARAVDLILADEQLWQTLSERYEIITGDSLLDMEQLQVKVSLFLADAMPDSGEPSCSTMWATSVCSGIALHH